MKQKSITMILALLCVVLAVILIVVLVGKGGGDKASASMDQGNDQMVINLKVANYLPPVIPQSTLLDEFAKDLEERTSGRVKVKYFPGGSLLKAPAMIKGIESGITDIGLSHIEYTRGRFPVMEVLELPLGYHSGWVANQVMQDFYLKFKPKEFDDVKVLWMHANSPSVLVTTKPIRTLEDWKGMTIRAPGVMGDVVSALGGTPSPLPVVEVYDGMAKSVIDGVFIAYESVKGFRLAEVAKYVTDTRFFGQSYPFYVAMNKSSYAKLTGEVKEIFDTLCGEYKEKYHLMWNAIDFAGKAAGEERGVETITLSAEEQKRWMEAMEPVIDNYRAQMKEKGFSESDVQSWLDYIHERVSFLNKRQDFYHIERY